MALFPRCVAACATALAALLTATGIPGARSDGTTPHLQEIFLGRCWEYQHVVNPNAFKSGQKNCTKLYYLFADAFKNRSPCDVPFARYNAFAEAASHPIEINKALFWEGVYELVHMYSYNGKRYTTISDTLSGYLADNLIWCGKASGGMNNAACPNYGSCMQEASRSFWRSISIQYARRAQGTVHVMLNGTRQRAFNPTSVFSQYELRNINETRVTTVHALLIHDFGRPKREHCGNGSLLILQQRVEERGLKFICTDNPTSVRHLLCVDNKDADECRNLGENKAHISHALRSTPSAIFSVLTISVSLLVLGS